MNKRQKQLDRQKRAVQARKTREAGPKTSTANGFEICNWVIAFLDLLGYRNMLDQAKLDLLPQDAAGQQALTKGLLQAIQVRRLLMQRADALLESMVPPVGVIDPLPKHVQDAFRATHHVHVYKNEGPDHIILGTSCAFTPDAHYPPRGLYALITNTAVLALTQLQIGGATGLSLPLRGGIAIGPGIEAQPENFLYSPALTTAYDIESHKADVPRIVVHENVVHYVEALLTAINNSPQGMTAQVMARKTRDLIITDDLDGAYILDFYGPAMVELLNGGFDTQKSSEARKFVADNLNAAKAKGDAKLTHKYEWLHKYIEGRAHFWP